MHAWLRPSSFAPLKLSVRCVLFYTRARAHTHLSVRAAIWHYSCDSWGLSSVIGGKKEQQMGDEDVSSFAWHVRRVCVRAGSWTRKSHFFFLYYTHPCTHTQTHVTEVGMWARPHAEIKVDRERSTKTSHAPLFCPYFHISISPLAASCLNLSA